MLFELNSLNLGEKNGQDNKEQYIFDLDLKGKDPAVLQQLVSEVYERFA